MKVASIVVTYNRKELLLRNILSQINQKQKFSNIIIVDNASTDGTYEFLQLNGIMDNPIIKYKRLDRNTGGAGGFQEGVKFAFSLEADYYYLMDDDGFMYDNNTLLNIIKRIPSENKIMINSIVICNESKLSFGLGTIESLYEAKRVAEDGYIFNKINPFNGTLISHELIKEIGFPNGDFFIRGDENDYERRAKKANAFIATIVDSKYYHPAPVEKKTYSILGFKLDNDYEAPWKEYYQMRNYTYIFKKESVVKAYLRYFRRLVGLKIFRIDNKKIVRDFIKLGFRDGMNERLGATIKPGQETLL